MSNKTSTKEEDSIASFKIAICGGGGVGKSCITVQYVQHVFDEEEVIISFVFNNMYRFMIPQLKVRNENKNLLSTDTYTKRTKVDGVPCKIDLIDTAGQDGNYY